MAFEIDHIIDRRRLKRSLNIWRIVGVLAIVGIIVIAVGRTDTLPGRPYVALLDVAEIIFDDPIRSDILDDIGDDQDVAALIIRINSPGGTFVGGENLFEDIRTISANKPVVAVIGNTGTSAAYMAALGADRIFAREGSLTGSIGVILQTANILELLDKIGVSPETLKSGELKAQPNLLEEFTPGSRAVIEGVITDMYDIFLGIVAERRGVTKDAIRVHADGRVFTGRQALAAGLVDEIGGLNEARTWLASSAEVPADLPLINVTPGVEENQVLGLLSGLVGKTLFSERLNLDGFLALWHPELNP